MKIFSLQIHPNVLLWGGGGGGLTEVTAKLLHSLQINFTSAQLQLFDFRGGPTAVTLN